MQTASSEMTALINAPRRELPGLLRVTFGIVDPTVAPTATIIATPQEIFSDVVPIIAGIEYQSDYQTLETNSFILGYGGDQLPISNYKTTGLTSSVISDANGNFPINPLITVTTPAVHDILGLTIKFDEFRNNWCDFIVRTYFDNALIESHIVTADKAMFVFDHPLDGWNKIEIEFTKTSIPIRRLRITKLIFGIYRIDDTFSAEIVAKSTSEVSPFSDKLPTNTFSWTLLNFDKSFKPGQEVGIQKYLMEQQPVKFEWGYSVGNKPEWVLGGNYLTTGKVSFPHNQVSLEATDMLMYMTDIYSKGKYYPSGVSLYTLAEEVLISAELPINEAGSNRWKLWNGLHSIFTVAPLPKIEGKALLQLIANCGGCVFLPDRNGDIVIMPMPLIQNEFVIDYNSQTSIPTVLENPPLYSVQVGVGSYILEPHKELSKVETTISGEIMIPIEYSTATNITANATNATIIDAKCYAEYAEITVSGNGNIIISIMGNTLKRSDRIYERVYGIAGEILPFDNILCTNDVTAEIISKSVGDFYVKRSIYNASYNGNILLDTLDRIYLENDFEQNVSGLVISNAIEYNGAWKGNLKWGR